jgi:hypothetical protein
MVLLGIVAILVTVGLSGCNEENNTMTPEKSKFVGTWQNSTGIVIDLFSDRTCTFLSINGTWDLTDGTLVLVLSDGRTINYHYTFSNNNQTLTLTNLIYGTTFNVTKQ